MSIIEAREREVSSTEACELTGATYRRLDYWCRQGWLGPRQMHVRSGGQRRFTTQDLELLDAIRQLQDVGCCGNGPLDPSAQARAAALAAAIAVVRARPVAAGGEYLIVTHEPPRARRFEQYLFDDLTAEQPPLWVVRLRSFDVPLQAAAIASAS